MFAASPKASVRSDWPAEFDWRAYTRNPRNGDLARMTEAQAVEHYDLHGRREGRVCSEVWNRDTLKALIDPADSILEIGPFFSPAFDKHERRVRYVDVFTTQELRERAQSLEDGAPERIPEIDYVWTGGPLTKLVPERFDAIYSSHNIEHHTCLVSHLQDLAGLLNPGGAVFLVIPDKRYCFDHFLPESTRLDVLGAWADPGYRHSARTVIKQSLFTTHNDIMRHWAGDHGDNPFERLATPALGEQAAAHKPLFQNPQHYVDAHAWHFTPESFRTLIADLHAMRLSPLVPARVYATIYGTTEFFAILTAE
jgi:hypothetical protein